MAEALIVALAVGVILVAAVVRGYSGFGFAMIGVAGISLTAPPDVAIPTVLILEVFVGLLLLPPVIRQIEWRPVLTLLAGALVLTPVGAVVLIHIPADLARVGIAIVIASAAVLLLRTKATRPAPGSAATVGVGGVGPVVGPVGPVGIGPR